MLYTSYHLVNQKNPGTFNQEIRKLISEGWQPYGHPAFFPTQEGGIVKMQAMVKPAPHIAGHLRAHSELTVNHQVFN